VRPSGVKPDGAGERRKGSARHRQRAIGEVPSPKALDGSILAAEDDDRRKRGARHVGRRRWATERGVTSPNAAARLRARRLRSLSASLRLSRFSIFSSNTHAKTCSAVCGVARRIVTRMAASISRPHLRKIATRRKSAVRNRHMALLDFSNRSVDNIFSKSSGGATCGGGGGATGAADVASIAALRAARACFRRSASLCSCARRLSLVVNPFRTSLKIG
jgi:hypothetical protein